MKMSPMSQSEMFVGRSAHANRCEISVRAAYLLPSPNVTGCSQEVAAAARPSSVARPLSAPVFGTARYLILCTTGPLGSVVN